jgi:hypothetical protein
MTQKYVALLTQSGFDAPVVDVKINDFGVEIPWERALTGYYRTASSGLFPAARTSWLVGPLDDQLGSAITQKESAQSGDEVSVLTLAFNGSQFNLEDGWLSSTLIDVTVWPE